MEKWEYYTINVRYDVNKPKNWVADHSPNAPLVGPSPIRTDCGYRGRKLASLTPDHVETVAGFGRCHIEPASYRATLKQSTRDRS